MGEYDLDLDYDAGWNHALDSLIERLTKAGETLDEHAASRGGGFNDADKHRLRGKAQGVRLALDYARGMRVIT